MLKIEKIKLGFIGVGPRGIGLINNVLENFSNVEITALCDVFADRVEAQAKKIFEKRAKMHCVYTDYNELLKCENVNVVIVSASWEAHVPLAVASMRAGKITALEAGGAYSVQDCYKLVEAYEQTKSPFMFLENCCYGKKELLITSMVRRGIFGEICYCSGGYCHDLREEIAGGAKNKHYRLRNYLNRNCDNYPTHELGPIARILNINRGNRMLSLVSLSSKSRGISAFVKDKSEYGFLKDKTFAQGDVVQTLIKCAGGELISLKLDTTLPRAYSRELSVSGTNGFYNELADALLIEDDGFNENDEINKYCGTTKNYEKYLPSCWKNVTEEQIKSGHGGMDTFMLESFFSAVIRGEKMPIDVYDAASRMSISCLSEASIAMGGAPVEIPDFTSGAWVVREPEDVCSLD